MLALWLQGPDPELKDLIVALQHMNLRRSARKLQEAIQKGEYQGIWSKKSFLKVFSVLCNYEGSGRYP